MTQPDFVRLVEALLSTARIPFERRQVIDFTATMWPLIEDDPDVTRWTAEFASTLPTVAVG